MLITFQLEVLCTLGTKTGIALHQCMPLTHGLVEDSLILCLLCAWSFERLPAILS